jgi:hypothetical protein
MLGIGWRRTRPVKAARALTNMPNPEYGYDFDGPAGERKAYRAREQRATPSS